jgi:D-alanyl-lipoteichoic acid acyltransferase DltB (MBOAT superfamily)
VFGRLIWSNILVGLTIMSIGLFKKTVIADTIALYADPLYAAADQRHSFGLISGWLSALTYTFQLYFDFSGYSDIAIGIGRMFGIKLPLNFHSPLRASNIAEYWRRWHMTLQRFIYGYIFQPLSLSLGRWSAMRGLSGWSAFTVAAAIPTFITFMVVGPWHGAGWNFVVFGAMHAFYVIALEFTNERRKNRRRKARKLGLTLKENPRREKIMAHVLTLAAVMFGNVVFRAEDMQSAILVWTGMVGLGGGDVQPDLNWGVIGTLVASAIIITFLPNTQQIMRRFDPAENWDEWRDQAPAPVQWSWRPNTAGLLFVGVTLFIAVMFIQRGQAKFLYFNF